MTSAEHTADLDPRRDYPLATRRPELLRTPTGKRLDDITMDAVLAGEVTPADLRIAPETLRLQAQIADAVGRPQLGQNFRRAAELTAVPDEKVLAIYNALRPRASTREELHAIAEELERDYSAGLCAAMVREAADVYERRGILAS
ncbi:propanediol dehydratase small subunit [Thermocatellispora tengchongensis]|uniref:Propanediol dehydratase small subunit n=1 Tax=Thermocatellispora tengchongensis TaxID=1073253 RepID=A0A840P4K0_9ACTN|nr:diol dehydratase small subunit [Thermocatellispora tengchongensis]MBB5134598.1 propanediol dehydratase small subunit [Thermocatellispora tengchongensis]